MKKTSDYLWGLLLIIVGVIFGVNSLGIAKINIFFEGWWTIFIILPGLFGLIDGRNRRGSLIVLAVGIILLLAARDIISFAIVGRLIVPVLLVLIGLMIIFKKDDKDFKSFKVEDKDEISATFAEQNIVVEEEFTSKAVSAVFGKLTIDLSKAKIKKEANLKVEAIFGAVEVITPDNVEVKIKNNAVFGGVENKKQNSDSSKVLYIDATAIFGGVSIR